MTTFDPHNIMAISTVTTVVSQSSNTLVIDVKAGDGALFSINQQVTIATLSIGDPFPTLNNSMVARITGISTDQITIDYSGGNREGTNVHTVMLGDYISNSITPKVFTDIENALNAIGSAVWGAITGTLSNQTDLQTALNAKEDLLGYTPEDIANKTTDGTLSADSDTLYPSEKAVKTYVDNHGGSSVTEVGFTYSPGIINGAFPDNLLSNANLDGSLITSFLAQPDITRRLQFNTSANGAMLTVIGTDFFANTITEDLDMSATTNIETVRAYKTITSLQTNSVPGQTVSVGVSEHLGMNRLTAIPYQNITSGYLDNGFYNSSLDGIDIYDPNEISKNVFHFENYPTHSDFKVYFNYYDIFDHQF